MALEPGQIQDVAGYFEVEADDVAIWHKAMMPGAVVSDREAVIAARGRIMAVCDHPQMVMLSQMLDAWTGPRPHV